jgi:hypothetical protein
MPRVITAEVKEIIDTNLTDIQVQPFIKAANATVTKLLGTTTDLSSTQKKEIERWLSAHLIACTKERQAKAEKTVDASITYQGETGQGIKSTHYGQTAADLDTTGKLANLGKRKVSLTAVESFD